MLRSLTIQGSVWLLVAACTRSPDRPSARDAGPSAAPVAQAAATEPRGTAAQGDAARTEALRPRSHGAAPPRGCALAQELPLRADAARSWAIAPGGEAHFLVLRGDRRTLEWWSGFAAPSLRAQRSFAVPIAQLSLLAGSDGSGSHMLAFVDDKGVLSSLRLEGGQLGAPKQLAQAVDRRFDPALAMVNGQLLVAFTRSVELAMHTFVARAAAPPIDVTPPGHGASAPTFVLGAAPPILVMIDARGGVSPLLELPFDALGKPGSVVVRTPVSQPYAPPALSALTVPGGELEVAFTAVGKLAATAIGRVPLRRAAAPRALHPSRGYGQLTFAVAVGARARIYALEVPQSESPTAPHAIEIKWLDAAGEGASLAISASSESARFPSLAAAGVGQFVLTYTAGRLARAALLHCDD